MHFWQRFIDGDDAVDDKLEIGDEVDDTVDIVQYNGSNDDLD